MAARPDDAAPAIPGWVTRALGPVLAVERVRWGFTNETWGVTDATGRRYAVTRLATTDAAAFVARRGPEIARRVGAAGVEMPVPIDARSALPNRVVVSSWLDGTPAMERLSGQAGAMTVGRAGGDVWRRLADVDVDGLDLDTSWAERVGLADAAEAWLHGVGPHLGAASRVAIARAIELLAAWPAYRGASFVHGDLVPANLLLRDHGPALVDLEAARIGDPLLDAAWFRWIVRYHHPELADHAWGAFTAAAEWNVDPEAAAILDVYPMLRILEILADADLGAAPRQHWIRQLDAAIERLPAR